MRVRDLFTLVLRWWHSGAAAPDVVPPMTSFTLNFEHVREVNLNVVHTRSITLDF